MKILLAAATVMLSIPIVNAQTTSTKTERTAFNAVKRVPLSRYGMSDASVETYKLDAQKALDQVKEDATTDEQKERAALLDAMYQSRILGHINSKYGELALRCQLEAMYAFTPDDVPPSYLERAKKTTCVNDYRQALDQFRNRR
jgi:hypothetical protein